MYRFRDLDPATDLKIRALAKRFGVPFSSIVDAAVEGFFARVMEQSDQGAESTEAALDRSEIRTLKAFLQMRETEPKGSDHLADLEADLAKRRSKLTDDLSQID